MGRRVQSAEFRVKRGENGGRTFLSAISIHITNGKHADGERKRPRAQGEGNGGMME